MIPKPHPYFSAKGVRDRQRKERLKALGVVATGITAGAVIGIAWAQAPTLSAALSRPGVSEASFTCSVDRITDGDTFRCMENDANGRQIRLRLSGIAARETDGSCADGHPCPTASAEAATAELRRLAAGQRLTCQNVGTTYGRIAAFCQRDDGLDLSCAMVASGTAEKWDRYWGRHRCP